MERNTNTHGPEERRSSGWISCRSRPAKPTARLSSEHSGPHGVNIMEFGQRRTTPRRNSHRGNVARGITVYEDRSFTFALKTPPAASCCSRPAKVGQVLVPNRMSSRSQCHLGSGPRDCRDQ